MDTITRRECPYRGMGIMRNKYKNVKTIYNNQSFDSKLEAKYCQELDFKLKAGIIQGYERQVRFPLIVNNVLIGTYIADFVVTYPDKVEIVDTKGFRTRDYIIKCKLMKACYGINIKEI